VMGVFGPKLLTLLLTAGRLFRNAAMASASASVRCEKAAYGMTGLRFRPSGVLPVRIAVMICSFVQSPIDV
jgi:hypothetical protein